MKKTLKPILILMTGILFFTLSSRAEVKFGKDWTYAYKTSEYACSQNGSFIRGTSQIAKALIE